MDSKQGGAERKGLLDMLYGYSERGCASYYYATPRAYVINQQGVDCVGGGVLWLL
jgi:hypothetical protein